MSTDQNNDSDNEGVLAPTVDTSPRMHDVGGGMLSGGGPMRTEIGGMDNFRESMWMEQYDGKRNLFDALGYISDPRYEHYRSRYERTDTASALVDKLPKKAWARPEVVDTGADDNESEFEKAVNNFLAGEYTEEDPIEVFERVSRMERLGNYGLIFLGLADDGASPDQNDLDEDDNPEDLLENEVDAASLENMDPSEAIRYITPYDQGRVETNLLQWHDEDPTHPRFGKPESYNVDLGDNRPQAQIHWSRLVHVVGNVFDDELKSPSVLRKSLNRIDDIEKILGGSAEGYWRAAYTGLIISPPEVNNQHAEFSDEGDGLHQQIERYVNNLSREIFTSAEVDTIDVTVEDPTGHLESQYKDISTGHDIPQSILMGNETGERATEEDREMWHERVGDFRDDYCFPVVLKPVIDRLIESNAFPEPEGGKYGYRFKWPPLDERSAQEEANIVQTISNSIATGSGGNPFQMMTVPEYRQEVLGWSPSRGSMVDGADDGMEPVTPEDLSLDEDDPRVQEQFGRYNELNLDAIDAILDKDKPGADDTQKLKVETPDGRGVIVEVLRSGFETDEVSVEASEEEPKVIVVTENEDKPWGVYALGEIEQTEWDSGVENPEKDMSEEGESRENIIVRIEKGLAYALGRENVAGDGRFMWPKSWRKSEKPARLIALDAWISMGGSVSACIREMKGDVADPGRFCADFADRLYQWDYWRGDSWAPGE